MRTQLSKLGIVIGGIGAYDTNVSATVQVALEVYEEAMKDHLLQQAAYGIAVCLVSTALDVTLKTAMLLFEHAITLRDFKKEFAG